MDNSNRYLLKWVNMVLKPREIEIGDVKTDFKDGFALGAFLEELTGQRVPGKMSKLKNELMCLNNLTMALKLSQNICRQSNVDARNFYNGTELDEKYIYAFFFDIVLHQSFVGIQGEVEQLQDEQSQQHVAKKAERDALLQWCNLIIAPFGLQVSDFTRSWVDGLAYSAILASYDAEIVDIEKLKEQVRQLESCAADEKLAYHKTRMGENLSLFETVFGVQELLDAEFVESPSDKANIMYLGQIFREYTKFKQIQREQRLQQSKSGIKKVVQRLMHLDRLSARVESEYEHLMRKQAAALAEITATEGDLSEERFKSTREAVAECASCQKSYEIATTTLRAFEDSYGVCCAATASTDEKEKEAEQSQENLEKELINIEEEAFCESERQSRKVAIEERLKAINERLCSEEAGLDSVEARARKASDPSAELCQLQAQREYYIEYISDYHEESAHDLALLKVQEPYATALGAVIDLETPRREPDVSILTNITKHISKKQEAEREKRQEKQIMDNLKQELSSAETEYQSILEHDNTDIKPGQIAALMRKIYDPNRALGSLQTILIDETEREDIYDRVSNLENGLFELKQKISCRAVEYNTYHKMQKLLTDSAEELTDEVQAVHSCESDIALEIEQASFDTDYKTLEKQLEEARTAATELELRTTELREKYALLTTLRAGLGLETEKLVDLPREVEFEGTLEEKVLEKATQQRALRSLEAELAELEVSRRESQTAQCNGPEREQPEEKRLRLIAFLAEERGRDAAERALFEHIVAQMESLADQNSALMESLPKSADFFADSTTEHYKMAEEEVADVNEKICSEECKLISKESADQFVGWVREQVDIYHMVYLQASTGLDEADEIALSTRAHNLRTAFAQLCLAYLKDRIIEFDLGSEELGFDLLEREYNDLIQSIAIREAAILEQKAAHDAGVALSEELRLLLQEETAQQKEEEQQRWIAAIRALHQEYKAGQIVDDYDQQVENVMRAVSAESVIEQEPEIDCRIHEIMLIFKLDSMETMLSVDEFKDRATRAGFAYCFEHLQKTEEENLTVKEICDIVMETKDTRNTVNGLFKALIKEGETELEIDDLDSAMLDKEELEWLRENLKVLDGKVDYMEFLERFK